MVNLSFCSKKSNAKPERDRERGILKLHDAYRINNDEIMNSEMKLIIYKCMWSIRAQVVGWPPVRSYRKNIMKSSNNGSGSGKEEAESEKGSPNANANGSFVKVSMDGAPYLRKVDLNIYSSYQHLSDALAKMFGSFTLGNSFTSLLLLSFHFILPHHSINACCLYI